MSKNYKFLVVYVFSVYDEISRLENFVKSYDNNYSGYPHELLICYKLINKKKLSLCRNILSNIKHKEFIDPININDFEFKTMERAIQSYNNYLILFLISHCCFEKKNWLKIINDSYEENSFVGFSGSNESMFTSLKFKKLWKFISFLKNYFYFKKNFAKFPNPHVRLPSFVLKQKDFLEFVKNKNYLTKKDAWRSEAGISGMTNFFLNKKFKVYIINSEAEKFTLFNMFQSFTFCNQDISKIIISDRHTRNYFLLSNDKKNDMKKRVWGS
jgi:hypothetical protein